jgi:DNA polymerase-3 subunit alpha (Gram-positive type)
MPERTEWRERLKELAPQAPVDKLTLERVSVHKKSARLVVRFLSSDVLGQEEYARLKEGLLKMFGKKGGVQVDVAVSCPTLADDFMKDPEKYAGWLQSALTSQMPSAKPHLVGAEWAVENNTLTLTVQKKIAADLLLLRGADGIIGRILSQVFRRETAVQIISREQEIKLEQYLEARKRLDQEMIEQMGELPKEKKKVDGPKVLYGRKISQSKNDPIGDLDETSGRVCVEGFVLDPVESKELRGGFKTLITFGVTDYTGSILCKVFLNTEQGEGKEISGLKPGIRVKVRGGCQYDNFSKEVSFMVDDIQQMPFTPRRDEEEVKRVELHLHTQMSNMDGVSSASALIKRAAAWGHEAIAITDHGVVQAYPEAFDTIKKLKKSGSNIKLIPGMEGYLIDDSGVIVSLPDEGSVDREYVVLDIETTGLHAGRDKIIEIAAVKIGADDKIVDEYHTMVNPGMRIPPDSIKVHNITDDMVADAPAIGEVMPALADFCRGHVVCAHNAPFDIGFLRIDAAKAGVTLPDQILDTLPLARAVMTELKRHKLDQVCKKLDVKLDTHHRALFDTRATAHMLIKLLARAKERGVVTLRDLNDKLGERVAAAGTSYHIVILAKERIGLENLYRLISDAHLKHFDRRPHILKSELVKYRQGLILGSACEAGELIRAMVEGKSEQEIERIASFYDYLEIQPTGNNAFMVRQGLIKDEKGLQDLNRRVLALGDKLGKPVCATCDVHFMDPEDAVFREILMTGMGFDDADQQAPLYLRTTREMLDEFAYLGDRAREVVIDNPRKIADMVEEIKMFPKHPRDEETFQPQLPNAEQEIERMAWENARGIYGDPLPEIVSARLERELKSILGHGFGTLYYSAHLLVKKSNEDGFLVGSRGSVGSSFAATMCNITEVNPLPPHYVCPNCRFSDFDVDVHKYPCGIDLPERKCPKCGADLKHNGYDIPFEVFLGFNGDKVPDIDLNFSGIYQHRAHEYVKELFGQGQVFKAGTIGTLADKTAYGYVKKWCEEKGHRATNVEMDRLVKGCVGVKRTTGQHPAGMVIVPDEYTIYQFSPIQHPADDKGSGIVTTHFDFGSLHDILVKLDVLGHDDPTMINMLERLTGIKATELPLNDPKVLGLFSSPEPLDLAPNQIRGVTKGTLGIPEFGTKFVRQMLEDTKPSTMAELIRISGLSHGTDVWLNNAQDMILSGICKLNDCFCTRDDIMNYLISMGVAPKMAFTTMEAVRKGRGLTPEMEAAMREKNVPEHYIDSCKKIKYMFPKGHAAAYVMMALRVAWFKVYRPLEYYATFFTVRADNFDAILMLGTPEELDAEMNRIDKLGKFERTAKDDDTYTLLELVYEMRARGFDFLPVDLYKSTADEFLIEDGCIRPPFNRLPGVGGAAAEALYAACQEAVREDRPFISVEDLKARAGAGAGTIEQLRLSGALRGLPETSQVSLF